MDIAQDGKCGGPAARALPRQTHYLAVSCHDLDPILFGTRTRQEIALRQLVEFYYTPDMSFTSLAGADQLQAQPFLAHQRRLAGRHPDYAAHIQLEVRS